MPKKKFHTYLYLIVKKVIRLIVEKDALSEQEAILNFYQSDVYHLLEIEETKYWWHSAEALYDAYVSNKKGENYD